MDQLLLFWDVLYDLEPRAFYDHLTGVKPVLVWPHLGKFQYLEVFHDFISDNTARHDSNIQEHVS